jgi:natural product precursor
MPKRNNMKKTKKLSLNLNKEVINQLDKTEASNIKGGVFLTIWGSNCYDTNPAAHNCCTGAATVDPGACTSAGTVNNTAMAGTCCCNPPA